MTVNEIFAALGYVIIGLQSLAVVVFVLFSYQKASQLFFGGRKDINSEADAFMHSCFITAISVAVIHFSTSSLRDLILALEVEKMELRQIYYFFLFLMEFLFITCVFMFHKIRECKFSQVARIAMLMGLVICANQIVQFYIRGVQGYDFYMPYYKGIILFANVVTLFVISVYPVMSVLRQRKKQY
ncbi:hypothetical protein ABMY35_01210 [Pseudoalteromonas sp. BZB3]|uniref:hypothetical protein n=1 Tax=Pseudoalteromonas sp. BZB3 TaxID=3136670 RepID=UPI0032C3E606